MSTNIIILGASGDLALKKILPSMGALFAEYSTRVDLNIIPWSRKPIDNLKMNSINNLLVSSAQNYTNDLTCVEKIKIKEMIVGDYLDKDVLNNFINHPKNQDCKNIFYLAVPQSVNLGFILNLASQKSRNFQVLIDKPYAVSREDFQAIDEVIFKNRLEDKILFVDHYLFKEAFQISEPMQKFFYNSRDKKIETTNITLLEELGIENRVSFYEQTGAIEDMFFHLFNIHRFVENTLSGEKISKYSTDYSIKRVIKGQYKEYKNEVGNEGSKVETAFQILMENKKNGFELLNLESGKKMGEKLSLIDLCFTDGTRVVWNIYPDNNMKVFSKGSYMSFNFTAQKPEHFYIFANLLGESLENKNEITSFVDTKDIKMGWELLSLIKAKNIDGNLELY
jgi:glucose-6-phosphate 1-dehydrogenase